MQIFYFNVDGESNTPGWTAGVYATSPDEAVRVMHEHIDGCNQELRTFDTCSEPNESVPHVHFLNAWNNGRPIIIADIRDVHDL